MDIFLVWVAIVYFNKNLSSKFKKHILSLTGIHFDNIWQNNRVISAVENLWCIFCLIFYEK